MSVLVTGQLLGSHFRVIQLLGVGSWSTVYLCESIGLLDRYAAIKVVNAKNIKQSAADRFRSEIASCFEVDHPNVVRPYMFFQDKGLIALALEYVQGGDLRRWLTVNGNLPLLTAVHILERIADALQEIHSLGVIHRDIKPENVLLPALNLPKLADFGVAVLTGGPRFTGRGEVVGTVFYISPEYVENGIFDLRSDIYSLGVLAFELLAGQFPFEGENVSQILNAKILKEAPDIREFSPEVPDELAEIVKRSLARDPKKRFQKAAEFRDALQGFLKAQK
jgi:serine/threonine protein kinase